MIKSGLQNSTKCIEISTCDKDENSVQYTSELVEIVRTVKNSMYYLMEDGGMLSGCLMIYCQKWKLFHAKRKRYTYFICLKCQE